MSYPKIWVVEGADNSGKTTLAQRLAKKLGAIYVKGEYINKPEIEVIRFHTWLWCSPSDRIVICDRHPIVSDPIYAQTVRGKSSPLSPGFCEGMEQYYNIIYCRPPKMSILNFGSREQMEGVITQASILVDAYDRWWFHQQPKLAQLARVEYDWTVSDEEFDRLAEYVRRCHTGAQP